MATRIPAQVSKMRKTPRQARARATIEAILDASARILGERGWAGFTTNAAADFAGVSIGSLYQYFPNKVALVEAVRQRHLEDVLSVLKSGADETKTQTDRVEALVDGMIAIHSRFPAAHQVLLEESPRADDARQKHVAIDAALKSGYEAIVRATGRGGTDLSVPAQILAGAIAGAVHVAASKRLLGDRALRDQLIGLVSSYLQTL